MKNLFKMVAIYLFLKAVKRWGFIEGWFKGFMTRNPKAE